MQQNRQKDDSIRIRENKNKIQKKYTVSAGFE